MLRIAIISLILLSLSSCNKEPTIITETNVIIYPNPFSNNVHLYIQEKDGFKVSGIKILDGNETLLNIDPNKKNITIDLSHVSDGIYHLESTINGEKYIQRLIKITE